MSDYNSGLDRHDRGGGGGGTMDAGITDAWLLLPCGPIEIAYYQIQQRPSRLDHSALRAEFVEMVLRDIEIRREVNPERFRGRVGELVDTFLQQKGE